jgi:PIN domain nuclease of toxin-antitoxin system
MDNPHLSTIAKAAIANTGNQLMVGAAAGYEITYKQRLGRLPPLREILADRLRREGSRYCQFPWITRWRPPPFGDPTATLGIGS